MNTYLHKQLSGSERTRHNYLETRIRTDENISQALVACIPLYFYNKGSLSRPAMVKTEAISGNTNTRPLIAKISGNTSDLDDVFNSCGWKINRCQDAAVFFFILFLREFIVKATEIVWG